MAHFGVISPPVSGHINPFSALGRELQSRGHRVTFLNMLDIESKILAEGIGFRGIGLEDHPKGTLPEFLKQLGAREGMSALQLTIGAARRSTEMFLRDGPDAIRSAGIDTLLVDQTEPSGASLAERTGIPFVTICNALAMNRETGVPPPFSAYPYRDSALSRIRNWATYKISDRVTRPIFDVIKRYREQWTLPAYRSGAESFSKLAQISQQPKLFDFPRRHLPSTFHYVGPLRNASPASVDFPWDRLDGRPLIYASLGSLQGSKQEVFQTFAKACASLPVQLVISHGASLDQKAVESLGRESLVVSYAPQYELLARASLTLTHAGLNTVLDSLSHGVPMVAVPLTFEQPAIAQRVLFSGSGLTIALKALTVEGLRTAIQKVLGTASYRAAAEKVAKDIRDAGGVRRAADITLEAVRR